MATCIICKEVVDDPIFLRDKGVEGVNFASSQRKRKDVVAHIGSAVHKKYRKRYVEKVLQLIQMVPTTLFVKDLDLLRKSDTIFVCFAIDS